MSIKRINEFPEGSGSLTNDDIFLFMDNPSASGVTKKISLSQIASFVGGGGISLEEVQDNLGNSFLIGGTGIHLSYGDNTNSLTINISGLASANITDFNNSVSGLLSVKNVIGSGNINISSANQVFTVSSSGLVQSNINGITGASGVNNIVQMTQANYNALASKDPNTVYFIV